MQLPQSSSFMFPNMMNLAFVMYWGDMSTELVVFSSFEHGGRLKLNQYKVCKFIDIFFSSFSYFNVHVWIKQLKRQTHDSMFSTSSFLYYDIFIWGRVMQILQLKFTHALSTLHLKHIPMANCQVQLRRCAVCLKMYLSTDNVLVYRSWSAGMFKEMNCLFSHYSVWWYCAFLCNKNQG